MEDIRYQVLWDNRTRAHPDAPHGIVNFPTGKRKEALREVDRLKAEGHLRVTFWDTLDNQISAMFALDVRGRRN